MTSIVITGSHFTPAQAFQEQLPLSWQVKHLDDFTGPRFKRYDWRGSVRGLTALPGLVLKAKRRLQLIKATAVVSFGGYSSVPVCLAAKWLGLPLVIHEQTFGAGLATRLTAGLADKIAISWRSSRRFFPRSKTVLTGNPVRQLILNVRRRPRAVIYITGGHQGSRAINRAVAPLMPPLVKRFTVYHQFGLNRPPAFKHRRYICRRYFSGRDLARIYTQARLAVGRAGINTVTELGYLLLPAVLIPLPYTQKNEQETNARYLEQLGLATVLPQPDLTPAAMLRAIDRTLALSQTRRDSGFPRARTRLAAQKLYQLVRSVSREA